MNFGNIANSVAILDVQVWVGLCCCYNRNYGGIYLVHSSNNIMEVHKSRLVSGIMRSSGTQNEVPKRRQ